jgi:SAM-dependent methyltransferase
MKSTIQNLAAQSDPIYMNRGFSEANSQLFGKLSELVTADIDQRPRHVSVLDIGCGNGRALSEVVAQLSNRVDTVLGIGVDLNPVEDNAVDKECLQFVKADAQDLNQIQAESIDIGFSVGSALYFADPLKAFLEVNRLLRPGGVFLWNFATHPLHSHITPHFQFIRDQSPGMEDFFSIEQGVIINHKPFVESQNLATKYVKLAAYKGSDLGYGEDYRSECWNTVYGHESSFDGWLRRKKIWPKRQAKKLDQAKLAVPFNFSKPDYGYDNESVPLAPLLNLTDSRNSQ